MTTPNKETIQDPEKLKKFMAEEIKPVGFSEEDYAAWLEHSNSINPGANKNNPWIVADKQKERDI